VEAIARQRTECKDSCGPRREWDPFPDRLVIGLFRGMSSISHISPVCQAAELGKCLVLVGESECSGLASQIAASVFKAASKALQPASGGDDKAIVVVP
jgi:hypothetical protein